MSARLQALRGRIALELLRGDCIKRRKMFSWPNCGKTGENETFSHSKQLNTKGEFQKLGVIRNFRYAWVSPPVISVRGATFDTWRIWHTNTNGDFLWSPEERPNVNLCHSMFCFSPCFCFGDESKSDDLLGDGRPAQLFVVFRLPLTGVMTYERFLVLLSSLPPIAIETVSMLQGSVMAGFRSHCCGFIYCTNVGN